MRCPIKIILHLVMVAFGHDGDVVTFLFALVGRKNSWQPLARPSRSLPRLSGESGNLLPDLEVDCCER